MFRKYVRPIFFWLVVAAATAALSVDAAYTKTVTVTIRVTGTTTTTSKSPIPHWAVIASIAVLALGAFVSSARGVLTQVWEERTLGFRRKVENHLQAILVTLGESSQIKTPWSEIGLHAWLIPASYRMITPRYGVRRHAPKKLREYMRRPQMTPALKRRGKLRMKGHQTPTGIDWRRGRGAIGKCWDTKKPVFFNNERDYAPYWNDEAAWNNAPDDITMNLRFSELGRLEGRYGDVVVYPIFKARNEADEHPEVVGCIAFDTPAGKHESRTAILKVVAPAMISAAENISDLM